MRYGSGLVEDGPQGPWPWPPLTMQYARHSFACSGCEIRILGSLLMVICELLGLEVCVLDLGSRMWGLMVQKWAGERLLQSTLPLCSALLGSWCSATAISSRGSQAQQAVFLQAWASPQPLPLAPGEHAW